MIEAIQNIDWTLLHGIRSAFTCSFMDTIMPLITHLGDGGMIWLICGALLLASKRYRRDGIMLICALALGGMIGNLMLKNLTARSRPCWLRPDVPLLVAVPHDYSFPSGHTLSAVIGAALLARANRKFGCAAIPLAALIAFSRLYLFVHFPSDVLASVILGIAIAAGISRAGDSAIFSHKKRADLNESGGVD